MIKKILWNKKFPLELDTIKIVKHHHFENTFCIVINLDWMEIVCLKSKTLHFHFNGNNNKFELLNLNDLYSKFISKKVRVDTEFLVLQIEIDFELGELLFINDENVFNCNIDLLDNRLALIFDSKRNLIKSEKNLTSSYHHNYVYATGSMKSGTTWVEEILNSSSQLVVLHEGNTGDFAKDILNRNLKINPKFKNASFIKWLPLENKINSDISGLLIGLLSRSILDFYMSLVGVKTGVDRTASSVMSAAYHVNYFDNTKIVHIVRNPFDVLISQIFHQLNLFKNTGIVDEIFINVPFEKISSEIELNRYVIDDLFLDGAFDSFFNAWVIEQNKALDLAENSLIPVKIIRYEDLINTPINSIQELFSFLEIKLDVQNVTTISETNSFFLKSSGRKNGEEDKNSFFRKGIIGDYKNYFIINPISNMDGNFIKTYNIIYPN